MYNKGYYDKMRDDTKIFSKEKYFNGQQNTRNIEDNWKMIKTFMQQAVEKHVRSKGVVAIIRQSDSPTVR